ncbi:MAG: putative molybdenum carrier protein [Deltaproteobacteria bacterium]|nr:putative molybdenum carrier protein [Deltaproteobacteria bacterium]
MVTRQLKIISGGQTGADRAALDAAIELGLDYGGAIPKGRIAEDGALDTRYERMTELYTADYDARTEKNVLDADATLIFTSGVVGGGSSLTVELARKYKRPFLHINFNALSEDEAMKMAEKWLNKGSPDSLNVAGSRESASKGIYEKVYRVLKGVFH